ncbi:MAG TPA: hypothetical protein VL547_18850, partial [Dinghuibacter sp.]|uniref:hypothetical protein n=1 Tax=Dinghuibacter sp. TaxID=2024697 RepID=UPI002C8705D4
MRNFLILLACLACTGAAAQVSGSFVVDGDINSYYPVIFQDGGFGHNEPTDLRIGRSNVHQDAQWRGALISDFRFHTTDWGNGSHFIEADVRGDYNGDNTYVQFVGGYRDVSLDNGSESICIWLRGGSTTYFYNSNYAVNPVVYDGVQNALPYTMVNDGTLGAKTTADSYVNNNGLNVGGLLTANNNFNLYGGSGYNGIAMTSDLYSNYSFVVGGSITGGAWAGKFVINYQNHTGTAAQNNPRFTIDSLGNVGIGTQNPQSLLAVAGTVTAKQVTVTTTGWSDFVFAPGYVLPSLDSVAAYAQQHRHLPGIPSAAEV